MSASLQRTIAIRPAKGGKPRKITVIAGLGGDGFSVLAPCHKSRSGFLVKHPIIPDRPTPRFIAWDAAVPFTADDRAKLDYHADGFVEFSGDRPGRITAARDPVSGEAKGLGLFSLPLSRPPFGGPTVALRVYGLDQFEITDEEDGLIVFESSDFYYRNCTPENANAWALMIYAFPKGLVPPVRFRERRSIIRASLEPLNGPMGSVIDLVAISLSEEKVFLGLYVSRSHIPIQSESGWLLSGPGDWGADRRGHALMGIYPKGEIPSDEGMSSRQGAGSSTNATNLSPSEPTRRPPPRRKVPKS